MLSYYLQLALTVFFFGFGLGSSFYILSYFLTETLETNLKKQIYSIVLSMMKDLRAEHENDEN